MNIAIVIIGGGFGGLEAAFTLRGLVGNTVQITLVDRNANHAFIPAIHEISSGKVSARDLQIPLETVLSPAGIRFVRDEVREIDTAKQRVVTGAGVLDYDYLVLAAGAENNFFGVPGAEEFSHRFRSIGDAERIHADLVRILSEHRREAHLVLAGGGTEGIEAAGEVVDLITSSGCGDDLAAGRITVTVVEGRQQLLPGFPGGAGQFAAEYLQKLGVAVMTGRRITSVQKDSLTMEPGLDLPRSMLIWSGGIKPSRIVETLALPKDSAGWLLVTDRLHSSDDERVYAVGDAVSIFTGSGPLSLQRLAYQAQDQAVVAGVNISYHIRGKELIGYTPRQKPQLISIGGNMGILTYEGGFRSGAWVVALKKAVERRHLMAYVSRPLIAGFMRKLPGADLLQRLKLKLPV